MSYLANQAVKALVAGEDLTLVDIKVANKEVRYKGVTVLSYWASLFNQKEHHISFHTHALPANEDGFVIELFKAAMLAKGVEGKVFTEEGKLFVSNGLWNEELRTDGVNYSMDCIKGYLALAPSVIHHNQGNSESLIYDYNQYQKFGELKAFCVSEGLSENQALHSFEVAKKLLEQAPELSENFVCEVW